MPQEKSIGMMNDGYFVGRNELLQWVNEFFQFSFSKIEQVCTGAVHCQIIDALFPGEVPLHKVNFNAKYDYEYIKNYKILQSVFNKLNIAKVIEVNKLIKGKYQDNLEFLQWMKKFFDLNWQGGVYDAAAKRKQAIAAANNNAPLNGTTSLIRKSRLPQEELSKGSKRITSDSSNGSDDEMNKIRKRNAQLSIAVDNLEKERDFYFGKLRDIEILCQTNPTIPILKDIERILYSTDGVEARFEVESSANIILPDTSDHPISDE